MVGIVLALATVAAVSTPPVGVSDVAAQVVAVWSVEGAGSGFPVAEDLVVTALHVTDDRTGAQLRLQDGSIVGGEVIASSESDDLALIRANEPVFDPLDLATGAPEVSTSVWALGDPPDDDEGVLVRQGTTAAPDPRDVRYLAFTADVRHGFSGGPLVNDEGEVVGVIDAKTPEGAALAVPVDAVNELIGSVDASRVAARGRPWSEGLLVGVLLTGGVLLARRVARRRYVRVRLGAVRQTAPVSPRLEER
jgi:S1-C subfamily serine protease